MDFWRIGILDGVAGETSAGDVEEEDGDFLAVHQLPAAPQSDDALVLLDLIEVESEAGELFPEDEVE